MNGLDKNHNPVLSWNVPAFVVYVCVSNCVGMYMASVIKIWWWSLSATVRTCWSNLLISYSLYIPFSTCLDHGCISLNCTHVFRFFFHVVVEFIGQTVQAHQTALLAMVVILTYKRLTPRPFFHHVFYSTLCCYTVVQLLQLYVKLL